VAEITEAMDTDSKDRRRLEDLRGGSTTALEELMAEYWAPLTRWAARELNDVEAARDVVQETFIQLWQRRGRWTPAGSARAYLFRITRSLVIDECRRRKVRWRWLSANRHRGEPALLTTPANELVATELQAAYNRAVSELPRRRREVFLLVYVHGLSHAEVAEALNISSQTVANQTASALKHLRSALRAFLE
jgi:RNA polymerase sigma-70 factor (family 1)